MSVLVRDGRTAIAEALSKNDMHLAWGRGNPVWNTRQVTTKTFDGSDELLSGFLIISNPLVHSTLLSETYVEGVDYTLADSGLTGKIVRMPAGSILANAEVVVEVDVGRPAPLVATSALIDEIGRRASLLVQFCTPDGAGEIQVTEGNYAVSPTPTNYLHLKFKFDFTDADTETIRELAVFINTATIGGLPAGQKYFLPAEVDDVGLMLLLTHINPLQRDNATRETFEFVITL